MEPHTQVIAPVLPFKYGALTLMYVKCVMVAITLTGGAIWVTHLVLRSLTPA